MLRKIWSYFLSGKVEDYSLVEHLKVHLGSVVSEHHRYLANQYELQRRKNEDDFNTVNETRERMLRINRERARR